MKLTPTKLATNLEIFKALARKKSNDTQLNDAIKFAIVCIELIIAVHTLLSGKTTLASLRRIFGLIKEKVVNSDDEGSDESDQSDENKESAKPNADPKPDPDEDSSSPSADNDNDNDNDNDSDKKNANHPGRQGVGQNPNAETRVHKHDDLSPGQRCPVCGQGRLYNEQTSQRVFFEASEPIKPVVHYFEDLRLG